MEIRNPLSADREEILRILGDNMSSHFMPEMKEELERVLKNEQIGFLAQNDSSILGYITCLRTAETYKLETLAVDKSQQGKGYGRLLVDHICSYLLNNTAGPVVVNVVTDDASDDPVQEFYKKCGFSVSGIVENEFRLGDRQVHLAKILRE